MKPGRNGELATYSGLSIGLGDGMRRLFWATADPEWIASTELTMAKVKVKKPLMPTATLLLHPVNSTPKPHTSNLASSLSAGGPAGQSTC